MKIAIIGSRSLSVKNLGDYLPESTAEIVSGGAKGIDSDAAEYARMHGIRLTEFLPDYKRYGRFAPLKRNEEIADYADCAVAFWDGASKGTEYTITLFRERGKDVKIVIIPTESP